jgi:hypothetical protein
MNLGFKVRHIVGREVQPSKEPATCCFYKDLHPGEDFTDRRHKQQSKGSLSSFSECGRLPETKGTNKLLRVFGGNLANAEGLQRPKALLSFLNAVLPTAPVCEPTFRKEPDDKRLRIRGRLKQDSPSKKDPLWQLP